MGRSFELRVTLVMNLMKTVCVHAPCMKGPQTPVLWQAPNMHCDVHFHKRGIKAFFLHTTQLASDGGTI